MLIERRTIAAELAFAEVVFLDSCIRCYGEWDDVGDGEATVQVSCWLTVDLVSFESGERCTRSHVHDIVSRLAVERKVMSWRSYRSLDISF